MKSQEVSRRWAGGGQEVASSLVLICLLEEGKAVVRFSLLKLLGTDHKVGTCSSARE